MEERFLREAEADLARLGREPSHAGALAGLRAAFADVRAAAGVGPVGELARSAENLLGVQLDGWVPPTALAADLIRQAALGLFALDAGQRADLAERMDAVASGMGSLSLDSLPPRPQAPEPPLLTEREDGSLVSPGMFADVAPDDAAYAAGTVAFTPAQTVGDASLEPSTAAVEMVPPAIASTTVAPLPVAEPYVETSTTQEPTTQETIGAIVEAIQSAEENLGKHIGALVSIASGTDMVSAAVQQMAGELAQIAAEIKRQNQALAKWARDAGS